MFDILIFAGLILAGYFVGSSVEKKHFKKLAIEERELMHIPHTSLKRFPKGITGTPYFIHTSVVISQDYFKKIMSLLVNVFGGRIHAYETLMDRARREAVVRLKKEALRKGAHQIYNLRLETSSINGGNDGGKNNIVTIEVIAYATALKIHDGQLQSQATWWKPQRQ